MTTHADFVEPYKRLRQVRFRLNNTLVRSLDKQALHEAARALGMLQGDTLVFDSVDQTSVLMDYGIYHVRRNGCNAIERYLDEKRPSRGSDERIVLEMMLKAYYSILQVADIESGVGVSVHDMLRDESGFLVDIGLSTTAPKGIVMATRVTPEPEGRFLSTGGAALPALPPTLALIQKDLNRTFARETDFTRLTAEQEAVLAALVIRHCIASEAATRIGYAEPGQLPSGRPPVAALSTRPRANRNDPCPCGSGRKYKSCCGKRG
jgi:hypothetical protein